MKVKLRKQSNISSPSKIHVKKSKQGKWGPLNSGFTCLKILTPKQILQRLPIAFAQVRAGNTSDDLLIKVRQIVYSLYWAKVITKKICDDVIKSNIKMDTIFMNSENSKGSYPYKLLLNLTSKIDLRRGEKSSYKNNKYKISASTWNNKFQLPDGSYSASDIQDYFE